MPRLTGWTGDGGGHRDGVVYGGAFVSVSWVMSPLIWLISRRMRVISSLAGVASARAHSSTPSTAGGQAFAGAQQVVEVAGEVGQAGTSVRKWSQPAQRNRTGQAPPPACTLDGSPQVPYGTATAPIAYRACSLSSRAGRLARRGCRAGRIASR